MGSPAWVLASGVLAGTFLSGLSLDLRSDIAPVCSSVSRGLNHLQMSPSMSNILELDKPAPATLNRPGTPRVVY